VDLTFLSSQVIYKPNFHFKLVKLAFTKGGFQMGRTCILLLTLVVLSVTSANCYAYDEYDVPSAPSIYVGDGKVIINAPGMPQQPAPSVVKERKVMQCAPGSIWSPSVKHCVSTEQVEASQEPPRPRATCGNFTKRMTITPPGNGGHSYDIVPIDTRCFSNGVIEIKIKMGKGSCYGSFDLFAENQPIPARGRSGSLVGTWDVPSGETRVIRHTFYKPQVFKFGAEGNWFSKLSTENIADINVSILPIPE
jgi:hypothetical protein